MIRAWMDLAAEARSAGEPSLMAGTLWTCLTIGSWAMVLGVLQ